MTEKKLPDFSSANPVLGLRQDSHTDRNLMFKTRMKGNRSGNQPTLMNHWSLSLAPMRAKSLVRSLVISHLRDVKEMAGPKLQQSHSSLSKYFLLRYRLNNYFQNDFDRATGNILIKHCVWKEKVTVCGSLAIQLIGLLLNIINHFSHN